MLGSIKITSKIIFVFLLLISKFSYSLVSDQQEPLELQANFADIDQEKHIGIYTGNVEFDQGTTHIRASKAVTKATKNNKISEAIIYGDKKNQAHYWSKISQDKPEIHAYADIICYKPEINTIELKGNARIRQGDNSFSAPMITYDTVNQHVTSTNMGIKNNGRTVIIFNPNETK